jgi:beta-lactamase class A
MLDHLRACDDKDKFPRFLPPGTKLAFKTGSLADTRTVAGIIGCPAGPVALCVLSCDNDDKRWDSDNAGNVLAPVSPARFTIISPARKPPKPKKSKARQSAGPH